MNWHFVLPAYNEEESIQTTVSYFENFVKSDEFSKGDFFHIWIVENGSKDKTWEIIQSLKLNNDHLQIHALQSPEKGIGHAYMYGLNALTKSKGDDKTRKNWIILSAADLPFAFTDWIGFRKKILSGFDGIMIGSKGHKQSVVNRTLIRTVMTMGFYLIRRFLTGVSVLDTQGTLCFSLGKTQSLIAQIESRDFFFSTEFIILAALNQQKIVEVPVVLQPELRQSTVNPIQDSLRMLKQLISLSKNLKKKAIKI